MSYKSNNQNIENTNEGQVVAVEQSSTVSCDYVFGSWRLDLWERCMRNQQHWRDFVATVRLAQCTVEANRQDVAMPPWYLLEGKMGMKMKRPYDPVAGDVEADEEWD